MLEIRNVLVISSSNRLFELDKYFLSACRRMGCRLELASLADELPLYSLCHPISVKTGYRATAEVVASYLRRKLRNKTFDLVMVMRGEAINARVVTMLKEIAPWVMNVNNDDPFGGRDGRRWEQFYKAVPYYDKLVTFRDINTEEAFRYGAGRCQRIWFAYDRDEHYPLSYHPYVSDITFIGTWMPERGSLMERLMRAGLTVRIFGKRWEKASQWSAIKSAYCGVITSEESYRLEIARSKIVIGLVSKGNRDLHTMRSFEIPAMGGFFLAERTSEHLSLYNEGTEAEFFASEEECLEKASFYARNEAARRMIASAGLNKVNSLAATYDTRLKEIIAL